MEQNEIFEVLETFVPDGFQSSPKDFLYYLKTLTRMRYNTRYHSIDVSENGIEVFIYRPQYTPTEVLTWANIERLVKAQPKFRMPDILEQLKAAF